MSAPADEEFAELRARVGVPLARAFTPVRQWIKEKAKPSAAADFSKLSAEMMAAQYDAIGTAAGSCDAVVATGLVPSAAAVQSVADKLGVPLCARDLLSAVPAVSPIGRIRTPAIRSRRR